MGWIISILPPGDDSGKECQCKTGDTWVWSQGEDLLVEDMTTCSSILFAESHGQRSLVGYSPLGRRVGDNWLLSIFLTQGWNPGLPCCRWIPYQLSHRETGEYWSGYTIASGADLPNPGMVPRTGFSCIAGRFFTNWPIREALACTVPHQFTCWSPNPNYLRMWLCL